MFHQVEVVPSKSNNPIVDTSSPVPQVVETPQNPPAVENEQSLQDKSQEPVSTDPSNDLNPTAYAPVQNTDSSENEPKIGLSNETQIDETATTEVPSTQVPLSQGSGSQEQATQATPVEEKVVNVDKATLPEPINSHENSSDSLAQIQRINETVSTEVPLSQDSQEQATQATPVEEKVVNVDETSLPEPMHPPENLSQSDPVDQIRVQINETVSTEVPVASSTQVPVAQIPSAQVPVAQVPVAQVPVAQVPVAQVPVAQVPLARVPVAQQPVDQAPMAHNPIAQGAPSTEVPVAQVPVASSSNVEPNASNVIGGERDNFQPEPAEKYNSAVPPAGNFVRQTHEHPITHHTDSNLPQTGSALEKQNTQATPVQQLNVHRSVDPVVESSSFAPPVAETFENPPSVQDLHSPQERVQESISVSTDSSNEFNYTAASAPVGVADSLENPMDVHEISSELDPLGQIDVARAKPHEMYNGANPHVNNNAASDSFKIAEMVPSKSDDPVVTSTTMTHMLSSHTIFDVLNNFYATHAIICTFAIGVLWIIMMTIQLVIARGRREEELNSKLVEAYETITKLKVDRNAFGQQEKIYKNENYNLEMEKNTLQRKLIEAEAKVADLIVQSQKEQVNSKVLTKLEGELEKHKLEVDQLTKSLQDSNDWNSQLKQEVSKLKNEKKELMSGMDKLSAEKDLLSVQLKDSKEKIDQVKALVDKKESELTELEDEMANQEEEFRNREEKLLDEQKELKKEVASLKEKVKDEAKRVAELKLELEEKVKRYDALKEVMKEIEQLTDSKDGINLQKVLDISQLQVEVVTLKEKSTALEEKVQSLELENESLRDKLARKEAEVKEQADSVKAASEAKLQAESELAYFQKYFAKRESEMTSRMAEIEAQRLNKEDLTGLLQSQTSKLLEEKEALEKDYQKLRSEFSDYESRSKKQIMKMDHDLNKQWTEWRKAVDDCSELRKTVQYLKQQLREITKASSASDVPDYGSDSGSLSGSALDLPPPPPLPPELLMSFMSAGGNLPTMPPLTLAGSGQPPPFLMSPPQMPPVSMSGGIMDELPPPPPPPMAMPPFLPSMVPPMVPLPTGSNSSSRPPSIALGHNESFPGLSNFSDHGAEHYSHPGVARTPPNTYQQFDYHQSPQV